MCLELFSCGETQKQGNGLGGHRGAYKDPGPLKSEATREGGRNIHGLVISKQPTVSSKAIGTPLPTLASQLSTSFDLCKQNHVLNTKFQMYLNSAFRLK